MTKFRTRLTLDRLDELALPSNLLPLATSETVQSGPSESAEYLLAVPSGTINFGQRTNGPIDKGTLHIESQGGQIYDLDFTVAGNETPEQLAARIAETLRRDGFSVQVSGGAVTVYTQDGQPVQGIGCGITGTNGEHGKLKPGTGGTAKGLQPMRNAAGGITGWEPYKVS